MSQTATAGAAGATTTDTAGAAAAAAGTTTAQGTPAAAASGTPAAAAGTPAAVAGAAATPSPTGQAGAGAGTATGTEGKTPEQIAADAAAAAAAAAAPQGAPATYALTVPEGGRLDQADLDAFIQTARENGLTNEAAQAVLNEEAARLDAQAKAFRQLTEAHAEIGGANLEQAQAHANKALDHFVPASSPEGAQLRSFLTKTGYGNHPAIVVMLSRIGKAMSEDTPLAQGVGARAATRKSTADVLFPSAAKS
jgi:hypothetical protein